MQWRALTVLPLDTERSTGVPGEISASLSQDLIGRLDPI
jgi:hypothetical protein